MWKKSLSMNLSKYKEKWLAKGLQINYFIRNKKVLVDKTIIY